MNTSLYKLLHNYITCVLSYHAMMWKISNTKYSNTLKIASSEHVYYRQTIVQPILTPKWHMGISLYLAYLMTLASRSDDGMVTEWTGNDIKGSGYGVV